MANTTNFNWETPDDTDLVKDGAAAIRTLGNSIDTSFVDLKGGTTGQILSKASNTDLDFTWTAGGDITEVQAGTGITVASGTGPIPVVTNSMATEITASGDIIVGTGSGTFDNLPIGTTGQVLTADTTVSPYKVKWASAAGGDANWSIVNSGGTALTGANSITISSISGADKLMIFVDQASATTATSLISFRFNSDTGSNYYVYGQTFYWASTYDATNYDRTTGAKTAINFGTTGTNEGNSVSGNLLLTGGNSSGVKTFQSFGSGSGTTGTWYFLGGYYNSASTISSVTIRTDGSNFDAGTIYIYKSA